MSTRVVFPTLLLLTFLLFVIPSSALYFPEGSHNRGGLRPLTGGTITIDTPSRLVRRQTTPTSTLKPVMSVQNTTDWSADTNRACVANINITSIINPAGVVPCYNVISFDPNNGVFISEVRLFQVVSMEQQSVMSTASGSGVLLEFPHATIQSSPTMEQLLQFLNNRKIRRQSTDTNQINFVQSFLMNGTADVTQKYTCHFRKISLLLASIQNNFLLLRPRP